MFYYNFYDNDTFYNRIETHPYVQFYINDSKVYYNNKKERAGQFATNEKMIPVGAVSLYELNIDRPSDSVIYPFITKGGSRTAFKTISTNDFNQFQYGDTISGSYPLSASISRDYLDGGTVDVVGTTVNKPHLFALKNTLNYYKYLSNHYAYNLSGLGMSWDKGQQDMSFISVPSIFYGSSIKKGTVSLKFYISGTLAAECKDIRRNGELVQTGPVGSTGSGSVAGVVLYNEGFLLMTGSWNLSAHQENYVVGGSSVNAKWIYFAATGSTSLAPSSSFDMSFQGTNYVPVLTMLAHAPKGELNHSSNPTYVEYADRTKYASPASGTYKFVEDENISIKNTVSSSFADPTAPFQKQTYISKIGIYDKDKNLIGVAKVANPVKKTEDREFTFKLKLDI